MKKVRQVMIFSLFISISLLGSWIATPKEVQALVFTDISTNFNSPIGIDYYEPSNAVVISANYFAGGQPSNLEIVNFDGSHSPFSTASGFTDEVKIAIFSPPISSLHQSNWLHSLNSSSPNRVSVSI